MSRMTSLLLGLRAQATGPRWLGALMLAIIAATIVWALVQAAPLVRAVRLPARAEQVQVDDKVRVQRFADALAAQEAQINGRSIFFVPPRPRPPRVDVATDNTPRDPPKPTRYGGPSLIAMVNGAVWFNDGQRVALGESGRGVKIVSMNAPWSARVEWQGVEFDVDLFQRDQVVTKPVRAEEPTLLIPPVDAPPAGDGAAPKANSSAPAPASPGATPPAPATPPAQPAPEPEPDPEPGPEPEPEPEPAPAGNEPDPDAPTAPGASPSSPSAPPAPPTPDPEMP